MHFNVSRVVAYYSAQLGVIILDGCYCYPNESLFFQSLTVWHWASYFNLLRLSFLIYKTGIIPFTDWVPVVCQAPLKSLGPKNLWRSVFQASATMICSKENILCPDPVRWLVGVHAFTCKHIHMRNKTSIKSLSLLCALLTDTLLN